MKRLRIALAVLLIPLLAGCGTIVTVFDEDPDNLVYSGTRRDFSGWAFIHGGFMDWPFSLVLDTILLPYTIPKTIANYAAADEVEEDSPPPASPAE